MNSIAFGISCATLVLLISVCVGSVVLKYANPAASRIPLPDAGGSQAGFDILPCVTSSFALAQPLAMPPRPLVAEVHAMGRGMNDFSCAESVAITIDGDKVWLEVDGVNVFRAYNIELIQVDDRRLKHGEVSQKAG